MRMKWVARETALALLAVMNCVCGAVPPTAELGEALFQKVGCSQCHGTRGHGGGNFGPPVANTLLPQAALIAFVRRPPPGFMPAYSEELLTDAQLASVAAFLQSVPRGKPASKISLLAR
jgi:mono/diheme cytochrome c family protein